MLLWYPLARGLSQIFVCSCDFASNASVYCQPKFQINPTEPPCSLCHPLLLWLSRGMVPTIPCHVHTVCPLMCLCTSNHTLMKHTSFNCARAKLLKQTELCGWNVLGHCMDSLVWVHPRSVLQYVKAIKLVLVWGKKRETSNDAMLHFSKDRVKEYFHCYRCFSQNQND